MQIMCLLLQFKKSKTRTIDFFAVIFLIVLGILFFKDIIFGSWVIWGDLRENIYPSLYLMFLGFQNSEFPLWNPSFFGGIPWFSYAGSMMFYPFHTLFVFFAALTDNISYRSVEVLLISHIILGGIFMYFFCSRSKVSSLGSIIGSVIFMFSSFFLSQANDTNIIEAAIWVPLLFLLTKRAMLEKKSWFLITIPLSFSILPGHPPTFFAIIFALFFYVLGLSIYKNNKFHFKFKNLIKIIAIGIISLSICAVFLVPVFQYHQSESTYRERNPLHYAYHPLGLVTLFLPSIWGATDNFGTSELDWWATFLSPQVSYMYLGIFPIALFLTSILHLKQKFNKEIIVLLFLGIFALFESLLNFTPLSYNFENIINFFFGDIVRQSSFFIIFTFSFAYLAARGFDITRFSNTLNHYTKKNIAWITLFIIIIVGIITFSLLTNLVDLKSISLEIFSEYGRGQYMTDERYSLISQNLIFNLKILLVFFIFSLILLLLFLKRPNKMPIVLTVLVFIVLDLSFFGMNGNFYAVDEPHPSLNPEYPFENDFLAIFKSDDSIYRIENNAIDTRWGARTTEGIFHGLHLVRGEAPVHPTNYLELLETFDVSYVAQNTSDEIDINSKFYDFFNVKYLVLNDPIENRWQNVNKEKWSLIFEYERNFLLYKNNFVMDRAFFVEKMVLFDSEEDIKTFLSSSQFEPNNFLVVKSDQISSELQSQLKDLISESPFIIDGDFGSSQITITEYNFNSIFLDTYSEHDGFLIISDLYHPGWKARIDNNEVELFPADLSLRGIYLPQGQHEVELYFKPLTLELGSYVSIIVISLIIFTHYFTKKKMKHKL